MLRRSRDLFRWARERRRQSDRLSEPHIFHQLVQRWEPVIHREDAFTETPSGHPRRKKFLFFWPTVSRV